MIIGAEGTFAELNDLPTPTSWEEAKSTVFNPIKA